MAAAIGVIDYGMGNLHSLGKALERVSSSTRVVISYDPEELLACDRIVLPGVGGVRECMNELRRLELNEMVVEAARTKPMLGICLGMQVMLEWSDENEGVPALGLFPGKVQRFPEPPADAPERLKVPHMGWNQVKQSRPHPIWAGVPDESWFYFVHSYYAKPVNPDHVLGTSEYTHEFAAAIARDNIVAFQFHPEKSQNLGMMLLANFSHWAP
ncbi:imidazole glycerol phosphate synthase subunit HisH [Sinimarinibacterium sp. CAU 1509]|uniref:imidazole glycerol phosphate synthase subunit HisH n=1 Tax=Sinimarinibacterium sp. CAU 1509 TaxID=2562283 RepID=UPI0010AD0B42|nr:imidazole glycerol phosphate synthase subunit HisH [Sinimarinibacterium sp. CAU 1509]TJY58259.1 imidazole glycerol phosphate synthase subunit HisH [Sinimarinibacterium sp. CAU 1509]